MSGNQVLGLNYLAHHEIALCIVSINVRITMVLRSWDKMALEYWTAQKCIRSDFILAQSVLTRKYLILCSVLHLIMSVKSSF